MGPIHDECGLEQGGTSSSDFYKIFGKEQLTSAQDSGLGVKMGNGITVSPIGQANETLLVSNSIHSLKHLLYLTQIFCSKYQVKLCAEKTKLQVFSTPDMAFAIDYAKVINPIKMDSDDLKFVVVAEHVEMLRSIGGNHVTILARITSHRGNPFASFHIHQLYGTTVLMSGLAHLLLSKLEINIIEQHFKNSKGFFLVLHIK